MENRKNKKEYRCFVIELEDNDKYRNVYVRMKSANKQKLINFYEELKLAIKNGNAVR